MMLGWERVQLSLTCPILDVYKIKTFSTYSYQIAKWSILKIF